MDDKILTIDETVEIVNNWILRCMSKPGKPALDMLPFTALDFVATLDKLPVTRSILDQAFIQIKQQEQFFPSDRTFLNYVSLVIREEERDKSLAKRLAEPPHEEPPMTDEQMRQFCNDNYWRLRRLASSSNPLAEKFASIFYKLLDEMPESIKLHFQILEQQHGAILTRP